MDNNLLLYFHIPRTGGSFLTGKLGRWDSRDTDEWLRHYNYSESYSIEKMQFDNIPTLRRRTKEQHQQIKFLSGHSIICNSFRWLKGNRMPLPYTIVRDPIDRILSSFNYKKMKSILNQDSSFFNCTMPCMDEWAIRNNTDWNDYATLYEYVEDCKNERNLQSKWLVKSFFYFSDKENIWMEHPIYSDDQTSPYFTEAMIGSFTNPRWFQSDLNVPRELVELALEKFWYITNFEDIETDTKDICKFFNINYNDSNAINTYKNLDIEFWTRQDIENQVDYEKLVAAFDLDFYVYDFAKKMRRPF